MPQNRFSVYSDEELMVHINKGQVDAFDELYARYGKALMAYFTRMLNFNRLLAEDALQDLFLKIAENPQKFDHARSFKTWIYVMASNTCKNFYRHQNLVKTKAAEIDYHLNDNALQKLEQITLHYDQKQFVHSLEQVLNELSPEKKEAVILRYQEEKTLAEIALIQNCAEGSVKSRLHYALKILEEKLKEFNPNIP